MARLSKGKKVERKKSSGIATLPGQAGRLRLGRHHAQRAVPGRGRLGRRLGQGSARQGDAGDAAAARQGAEHHVEGQPHGARQQGAAGHRHRDRRRSARRRGRRSTYRPALRQGHRHDRRRRRRRPHPGAAAHVLLHALAEAGRARPPLRRAAAALQGRGAAPGQGQAGAPRCIAWTTTSSTRCWRS